MAVSSTESGAPGLVSGGILRGVEPHDNAVLTELKKTLEVGTLEDLETTHPVTIVDKGVSGWSSCPARSSASSSR